MVVKEADNSKKYSKAETCQLGTFLTKMREEDVLLITADHGYNPSTASTDHSREYTPMILCGQNVKSGVNLYTRETFADIGATVLDIFNIPEPLYGKSFKSAALK